VLAFSDNSFAEFFASELKVDINDPKYSSNGGSKAKRLRYFLQSCEDSVARVTLTALWEHRLEYLLRSGQKDPVADSESRFQVLIGRVSDLSKPEATTDRKHNKKISKEQFSKFKSQLKDLTSLPPQPRGYAFESFLKGLFDTFSLEAKDPFRVKGEQIDGSFLLGTEIYLLEAKWQAQPIGAAELHTFHGKIEQKAAWTRGLFVSYSGFSQDGLSAFGRGKRVVCMDSLDLYEILDREIPLDKALETKVRRAAETGVVFARVRDLFP